MGHESAGENSDESPDDEPLTSQGAQPPAWTKVDQDQRRNVIFPSPDTVFYRVTWARKE